MCLSSCRCRFSPLNSIMFATWVVHLVPSTQDRDRSASKLAMTLSTSIHYNMIGTIFGSMYLPIHRVKRTSLLSTFGHQLTTCSRGTTFGLCNKTLVVSISKKQELHPRVIYHPANSREYLSHRRRTSNVPQKALGHPKTKTWTPRWNSLARVFDTETGPQNAEHLPLSPASPGFDSQYGRNY